MDISGEGGALVLRASTSSVEFPGFLAAYSAHVIRPAAVQPGNAGDGEALEPEHGFNANAASTAEWDGATGTDPTAAAIRSLQASLTTFPVPALCSACTCSHHLLPST